MQPIIQYALPQSEERAGELPAVSMVIPFDPKMVSKRVIEEAIHRVVQQITSELNGRYSGIMVELVLEKLQSALSGLNYSTHKCSVAIYISPVFEKVLYLDMPVEETVLVDQQFNLRDVINSKRKTQRALLLVPGETLNRFFLVHEGYCDCIVSNPVSTSHTEQRVRALDQSLDILLQAYPLPLFVAGTYEMCLLFGEHTRYDAEVIEYIPVEAADLSATCMPALLEPFLRNWELVEQKALANQLNEALHQHRLVTGVENILRKSGRCINGTLLIEKGYTYKDDHFSEERERTAAPHPTFSYIHDTIDDLIEKALLNGGDVEFVEAGWLPEGEHIALIQNTF